MAAAFHLNIITPDKKLFDGNVTSIVLPGADGYVGILAHHAPFMTTLSPGTITVKDPSGKTTLFDSKAGGFLEVVRNKAVLLADSAQPRE